MNLRRNLQRYINLYNYVEAYKTNDFSENYTELEYIESSGTQYIRTGINATKNTKIKLIAQPKSTGSTNALIGSNIDGAAPSLSIVASGQFFWGNGYVNFSSNINKHVYYIDTNKLYIDDELTATSSNSWDNTKIIPSLGLLVVDQGSSVLANYIASAKVYSLQVWNNNNLVIDLIPAKRNLDSVVGMYDKVSNTFFENDGTGEFVAGPELHPVEYINMTAGSYLLTDIIPTYDGHYEIDIQTTNIATSAVTYLGARTGSGTNNSLRFAHITNGTFRIYGFGSYTDSSDTVNANTRYNFVWNNNVATLMSNGEVIYNDTFSNNQTVNVPLAINGWNTDGTVAGNIEGIYCYGFKAWDNQGNLIADYVPMVKDTTPGMYDRVTSTFKEATVGEFIAGPELSDDSLVLQDAIKDSLKSLKAYGKTELKPDTLLDTVVANGGTEILSHNYIDSITAKGKTEQRKLPIGYQELEYLESTGTQYIDLGLKINQDNVIEVDWNYYTSSPSIATSGRVFGARYTAGTNLNAVAMGSWSGTATSNTTTFGQFTVDDVPGPQGPSIVIGKWFNGKISQTGYFIDDVQYGSAFTSGNFETPFTLKLFAFEQSTGPGATSSIGCGVGRCKHFKVWNGDILIMNLIPAKNTSGVIGMYDTVSCTFFTNSGTGEFIAGPIVSVPDGYTRLAYLTGDGTAYIDLGISLTQDDEFELDFIMPSSNISMQNIFGYRDSASSNAITAMISSTSNQFISDFNNSNYSPYRLLTNISASTEYKVITNKNSRVLYQGNTVVSSNTTLCEDTITTGNVLVFNIGGSPAYTNKFTGSISKVIIKNRINLIPAKRNSDGVLGMYDIINNQFYTNASETGAFIAGPVKSDVNPNNPVDIYCNNGVLKARHQSGLPWGYQRVEYVTNTAQTMINTGVRFDFSKNYEIELKASGVTGSWYILQARESSGSPISGISGSMTGNVIGVNFDGTYVAASQISRVFGHIYYVKGTINNGNMTLYVKDETAGTEETVTGTYTPRTGQSVDIGLFGNMGGNYVAINSDVYFARIKEDGNYIMDYVPCRQGTTVGFYDKVSGTFKTVTGLSAGTAVNDIEIYADGTVETIWVHSKNLFDEVYPTPVGAPKYRAIYVGDGTFTCSYNIPNQPYNVSMVYFLPGNVSTGANNGVNQVDATHPRTVTAVDGYVTVSYRDGSSINLGNAVPLDYNCMIEKGSPATDYEPYYDGGTATAEMLLSVGSYADTQEVLTGAITRNVGIKVLNGTENWTPYNGGEYFPLGGGGSLPATTVAYCSHFSYAGSGALIVDLPMGGFTIATNGNCSFKSSNTTTKADWVAWLAQQYAAGTPVIVVYPLKTATTETVAKQISNKEPGVTEVIAGSLEDLEVTNISSTHTIPSPDYPLNINCNNGVLKYGIYGKNLFDEIWQKDKGTSTQQATWGQVVNANGWSVSNLIPVEEGKKYTISYSTSIGQQYAFYYNADGIMQSNYANTTTSTLTVTIPSGAKYMRIQCNKSGTTVDNINTQVEQNNSATPYEPYKFGIYTDGIVETIWAHGKNLFDENNIILGYFYEDNGTYTSNANTFTSGKIPMNAGTTVTFSRGLSVNNVFLRIHAFNSNNEWIGLVAKSTSPSSLSTTGTTPANTSYIRVCGAKKISSTEIDHECQVELGSTATTYEPYYNGGTATTEMLLKAGAYTDTHDVISGVVTRNIGIKVLDGTENWVQSDTKNDVYRLVSTDVKREQQAIFSTHFIGTSDADVNMPSNSIKVGSYAAIPNYGVIAIRLTDVTTLADFNAFLTDQYAAGTPVIVVYPLATATTETVDKQRMHKGTVSITEASMTDLTVDTTESVHTIPSPDFPLDLYCNNGKLSLLDGYTRLDYIKSDGAQYIDTGINQATLVKPRIITKFKFDVNDDKDWFGGSNDNGGGIIWNIAPNLTKVDYIRWKTQAARGITYESGYSKNDLVFRSDFHTLNVGGVEESGDVPIIVDNNLIANMDSTTTLDWVNQNLLIFRSARSGQNGACSFSYFTIYSNDVKVWDGVACRRNSDNVLGMYDLVSGQFFTNKGTGTFTAGNPVILPVSIGTPESLTVAGKNLFDKNGNLLHGTYNATNGSWIDNESFRTLDYIPGKPGVSYTLSAQSTSATGGNAFSVQAWDSTHTNWLGTVASTTAQNVQYASGISPADTAYLSVSFAPIYRDIDTLQLEEGPRPTQYENYMNINCSVEDLLSVGNYQDIEDLKAGITNRKVAIKVLDGTEGWTQSAATNNLFYATISNSSTDNTYIPVSSHFQGVVGSTGYAAMTNGQFKHGSNTNSWYFKNTDCATAAEFSQFLAAQYAAETPVIVVYPLATETTESTITQSVDIVSGTNTIERNSEYFNSLGIEVNYKKLR